MIGNAIVDIWQAEGVRPILKYEDDLKIFRYPVASGVFHQDGFQYEYDRDEALSRISSLRVPWHKEKGDPAFLFITNFIGFRWHLPDKHVSLPEDKRCGSARLLTMFVVILLNQINYNQLPPAQPAFSPVEDSVPARTLSNVGTLALGSEQAALLRSGSRTPSQKGLGTN
jgi:hypothetical protein